MSSFCVTCGKPTTVKIIDGIPVVPLYCSITCVPPPSPTYYNLVVCLTCWGRLPEDLIRAGKQHHKECFFELKCKNGCGRRPTPTKEHCEVCYRLWMANNNRRPYKSVYPYCGCIDESKCSHFKRSECQNCSECPKGVIIEGKMECSYCALLKEQPLFIPDISDQKTISRVGYRSCQTIPKKRPSAHRSTSPPVGQSVFKKKDKIFQTCRCGSGLKFDHVRDGKLFCEKCF